jgi:mono/diheme cytochrome c family protein
MSRWTLTAIVAASFFLVMLIVVLIAPVGEQRTPIQLTGDADHGAQLLQTAGCFACHTDTANENANPFAGGPKLETPFGDFYAPNITSSKTAGIGHWTLTEFEAALRQGRAPNGSPYYPAFPFSSYRSLTDQDVADLFAALQQTQAVDQPGQGHDLTFPFNIRLGLKPWRWLFATTRSLNIDQSTPEGRGRYLVDAVAHCGECHNPRNSLGAFIPPYLGGNDEIPGGSWAPPIHGAALAQMDWLEDDLFYFLADGMKPDGDSIGGSMVEVIDYGTAQMTDDDRAAIAAYLFSLQR